MDAFISDIEGNLDALQAVLADIAARNVKNIYCLGDIVGYGPNPRECIDLIENCSASVLGEMDLAAIGRHEITSPDGRRRNQWTRRQLALNLKPNNQRREFLASLPFSHDTADARLVHGSPRDRSFEYLFPEDAYNSRKMESVFGSFDQYCFIGHTHIPGIFTDKLKFHTPAEIDHRWWLDGSKTICNVGSVGLSRDGDHRACYVLREGNQLWFRRVEFDHDAVENKLRELDE